MTQKVRLECNGKPTGNAMEYNYALRMSLEMKARFEKVATAAGLAPVIRQAMEIGLAAIESGFAQAPATTDSGVPIAKPAPKKRGRPRKVQPGHVIGQPPLPPPGEAQLLPPTSPPFIPEPNSAEDW